MKSLVILGVTAAASIALGATCANADDGPYTGFRVEAQGGWDHIGTTAKLSYDNAVFQEAKGSENGVTYGANVGYDNDMGAGFVLGTEAGINWSSIKYCTVFGGDDRACAKPGREIEVGIRAGKQFGDTGPLVYGKVAYVNGQVKGHDDASDLRLQDNRSGVRLGVGIEDKISRHVYVKAEYRYTDFKAYKFAVDGDALKVDFDRNQVIAGVGYLF